MKIIEAVNVTMTEAYPEKPSIGDWCFRFLTWMDRDRPYPCFELCRAKLEVDVDNGDIENGPGACSLMRGDWELLAAGMGLSEFEEVIKEHHCDCGQPECRICCPDPNIGR